MHMWDIHRRCATIWRYQWRVSEKALLQFDHVPHIIKMVQPLFKLIDIKKYKGSLLLRWHYNSDYGIGGSMYMVTNGQVRAIRFFSKSLIGSQLNWSAREKRCYGIYYGLKLFEDLLDNRYFILKTDHKNLTYIYVTFTCRIKASIYSMFLAKSSINLYLMPCHDCVRIIYLHHHLCIVALRRHGITT